MVVVLDPKFRFMDTKIAHLYTFIFWECYRYEV